jgi:hypothetical protein
MRKVMAVVLACTLSSTLCLEAAAGGRGAQAPATLAGVARNSAGQAMANTTVQLRDLATGQLVGTSMTSATGAFSFTGLSAGRYAVEMVNAAGQIMGTSAAIDVATGAAIQGVAVTASVAGGAAAAGGSAAASGLSTGAIVTITAAAVGAGVGVWAVHNATASPSQ